MTTSIVEKTTSQPQHSQIQRIVRVMRMQFVAKTWLIYTPIYMIAASFAITLAIVFIMHTAGADSADISKGLGYSWGILVPMWYLPTAAIIALNPTIHVAFAMSLSRREFYLGTLLSFIVTALFHGTLLTVLGAIEQVTGGYGLHMRFVDSNIYAEKSLFEVFLISTLLYFSGMAIFMTIAAIYLRWRTPGVLTSIGILVVILLGTILLIVTGDWQSTFMWLAEQTAQAFLWIGLFAAVSIAIGYLVIRKSTVRD